MSYPHTPPSPVTGGRIFYPGSHLPTACPLREDEGWRLLQDAAGPADQDVVEPEERKVRGSWVSYHGE